MPVGLTDSRLTHEYFARWGDVVHVGLSLNYRDVLVSAQERKQLRQKLYNAQVGNESLLYCWGGGGGPFAVFLGRITGASASVPRRGSGCGRSGIFFRWGATLRY